MERKKVILRPVYRGGFGKRKVDHYVMYSQVGIVQPSEFKGVQKALVDLGYSVTLENRGE